jgi:hypothetical protein
MKPRARFWMMSALLLTLAATGGCAAMKVQPWDRDLLSQKAMSFNPAPLHSEIDEHIYFSKEGSTGGMGVGGGGCGCN